MRRLRTPDAGDGAHVHARQPSPAGTWFLAGRLMATRSNGIPALQAQGRPGIGSYPRSRQAGRADAQGPEPETAPRARLAQAPPEHAATREVRSVVPQPATTDQAGRTCLAAPDRPIGMPAVPRRAGKAGTQVRELPPKLPNPVQDQLPTRKTASPRSVEKKSAVLVRSRRLELPRVLPHSDLNAARLPIPPRPHLQSIGCI